MELSLDIEKLVSNLETITKKGIEDRVYNAMEAMAQEWEKEAKLIVADSSVDTGDFLNSIHYEMNKDSDEIGFTGYDGVKYGIYHEFGTIRHWLPFFYYGDTSKPVLANWGRRVLKLTDEEMLAMGGIEVEIKESQPFMKAMLKIQNEAEEIFTEVFRE